jgi:hypothetical protein
LRKIILKIYNTRKSSKLMHYSIISKIIIIENISTNFLN